MATVPSQILPSLPTVAGACRFAANGGTKESHWKTVHRPFPAPYYMDKVYFKKLTGFWVTLKRQRSPETSSDKFSHQHNTELTVLLSLSQN